MLNGVRRHQAFTTFRQVGRGHVLAWRRELDQRALGGDHHPPQVVSAAVAVLAVYANDE